MFVHEKAVATITDSGDDFGPHGGFEAILSAPTLDRDGDTFATGEWKTPLPGRITIDVDHEMSVSGTVGSAVPTFDDDGNLCVRGTFASTARAQEVRTLIQEGHISTMSVACMTDKQLKKAGEPCRELLNGAFVAVPSNREALITSVKAGARNSKTDQQWIQAAHDATVMAGAGCVEDSIDGDGDEDGANKHIDITVHADRKTIEKAVTPMVINAKAVKGSLEDLQSSIGSALDDNYRDPQWSYLVATWVGDGGTSGTCVYRLYDDNSSGSQTLSRTFTVAGDGSVTLGTEVTAVELVTTTQIAEKAKERTEKSVDEALTHPILTGEQFEQLLAAVSQATSPTAGEPHSDAPPAGSPADAPAESPAPEGAADEAAANAADTAAGAESDVAGALPAHLQAMAQAAVSRLE